MSGLGDPWIHFSGRKMSALSGFCSLSHLDLDLFCTYQIPAGNAETGAGHLLDSRASVHSSPCRIQTFFTFSTLTGVGFSMKHIHGNSQSLMGFLGNGAVRHSSGLKPFYNVLYTFHFFNRDSLFREVKVH